MNEERIVIEATQEADEAIKHLARIKAVKRYIESEEHFWVDKVKSLINPATCDDILAQRNGEIITVAVYKRPFRRFDTQGFKHDYPDLYKEYLITPKPEEKWLYIQDVALSTLMN